MTEEWKYIDGNREIYMVSNFGNVKTSDRMGARGYFVKGHILLQRLNSSGYNRVTLNLNGKSKSYFVHRLVAKLFVENPNNHDFVNHKDGNKQNNSFDNLEWCTRSENEKHAWKIGLKSREKSSHPGEQHNMHKLTQKQVDYIRSVHKPYDKELGSKALGKKFNVNEQTITDIVHGRTWIKSTPYFDAITKGDNNG